MKKILTIIAVAFAFIQLNAQVPQLDEKDSFVIDTAEIKGKAKDEITLVNMSDDENIRFTVFIYDEKAKQWQIYGDSELDEYYDDDDVESYLEGNVNKYRYIAVRSDNGKPYKYTAEKRHDDLYIYVYSDGAPAEINKDGAYIIDTATVTGKYKDKIRLVSQTYDKNIVFDIYAFNDMNEQWQKYGVGDLKEFNDSDAVDSPLEDKIRSFKYFAVIARNSKQYDYTVTTRRNDLVIIVK